MNGMSWSDFQERVKKGLYLAANSFELLWKHKILVFYLVIPYGISLLFQLIHFNMYGQHGEKFVGSFYGLAPFFKLVSWQSYFLYFGVLYFYILLLNFYIVALVYHTDLLMANYAASIQGSLQHAVKKIPFIAVWSIIVTGVSFFAILMSRGSLGSFAESFLFRLIFFVVNVLFTVATYMILTIISLERATVKEIIVKAARIIKVLFVEIASGQSWIGFIAFFGIPFYMLYDKLLQLLFPGSNVMLLVGTVFILVFGWIISTIQVIFKTVIYNYYQEPIEEMEILRYPRF